MKTANQQPMSLAQVNKDAAAKRPAHALNDARVTLRDGAKTTAVNVGGASLIGGTARVGIVWTAQGDRAVVDFGTDSSGHAIRVVAQVADLIVQS